MFVRRRLYEDVVRRCSEQDEEIVILNEQVTTLRTEQSDIRLALQKENKRLREHAEQREAAHRRLSESSTRQEGNLATLLHKHERVQHEYTELSTYCQNLSTLLRDCLCYMEEVEIVAKKAGTVARLQQRTDLIERAEQLGIAVPEKEESQPTA